MSRRRNGKVEMTNTGKSAEKKPNKGLSPHLYSPTAKCQCLRLYFLFALPRKKQSLLLSSKIMTQNTSFHHFIYAGGEKN